MHSTYITLFSFSISFECQYENTSHLEVISEPGVLAPGEKSVAQILFYPRELKRYFERVPFEINGLSTTFLDITGEGTEMKVSLHYFSKNIHVYMSFISRKNSIRNRWFIEHFYRDR